MTKASGVLESRESRSLGSLGVLGVSGVSESQTVNCTIALSPFENPFSSSKCETKLSDSTQLSGDNFTLKRTFQGEPLLNSAN